MRSSRRPMRQRLNPDSSAAASAITTIDVSTGPSVTGPSWIVRYEATACARASGVTAGSI